MVGTAAEVDAAPRDRRPVIGRPAPSRRRSRRRTSTPSRAQRTLEPVARVHASERRQARGGRRAQQTTQPSRRETGGGVGPALGAVPRRARGRTRARGAPLGPALARAHDRPLRGVAGRARRRSICGGCLLGHHRAAPALCGGRHRAGRRGDHVAVLVRGERELLPLRGRDSCLRGHRPADAQSRSRGRRGRGHRADEGDRRRRHLRLPMRARRAARDRRPARPRTDRRLLRGARRRVSRSLPSAPTAPRASSPSIRTSSSRRARVGWSRRTPRRSGI